MKAVDMLERIEFMMRTNDRTPHQTGSYSALVIEQFWKQAGKVVVQLDDDLAAELIDHTELTDEIDTRVLQHLMLINPLVLFSEPVETVTPEGWRELIYGFYVYGKAGQGATYTNASDLTAVGVQVMSEIFAPHGWIFESRRVSLPIQKGRTTIRQLALDCVMQYVSDDPGYTKEQLASAVATAMAVSISVLMYLSTDDCDIEFPRWSPARKKQAKRNKELPIGKLGWNVGKALKAARVRYRQQASEATGSTVRPHQRRGHFALRWTGQGRTVPKVVWVRPTFIHVDTIASSGGTIRKAR